MRERAPGPRRAIAVLGMAGALAFAGCAVGPDYQRPTLPTATDFKSPIPWAPAQPNDAVARGDWWRRYGDAELSRLESLAMEANSSVAVARAQLEAARGTAGIAGAGLLPRATLSADALRSRLSASRPTSGGPPTSKPAFQNQFDLPLQVGYEVDLFGGVRRNREATRAGAEAAAADLENARLVVAAEVASDYFALRETDAEIEIDSATIRALEESLRVIEQRHRVGTASGLDLAAQQAQLAGIRADLADARALRASYENALAALCGVAAPQFRVPPAGTLGETELAGVLPGPLLPGALLQRRPDVAAAERRVAAANAAIGVAQSAYFPTLNLTTSAGFQSVAAPLVSAPNLAWALGAYLSEPVFDGGRRKAGVAIARADYEAAVARLREVALTAFAETEDALSALANGADAARARAEAVREGQTTVSLATRRYEVGVGSYLDLLAAQQSLLASQRSLAQAVTRQRLASVLLVKSVGGDY